ncbi:MAG: EF-P beta-lysylation protein EpmB [Gammaproteobacteria bacterium]|nr:EF-P beta-lysylation protein EpmB [Gammaproteobacteria bacterium]MDH5592284.1 EF-P beta-lysylation protein EpmB [Gammaproteobacteria bacterium]
MIPQTQSLVTKQAWQVALANTIKDPEVLLKQLGLADKLNAIDGDIIKQFPLRVPQSYVNRMRYGDPDDPLLRQVFPLLDEGISVANFVTDPVGDHLAVTSPGMLQKYTGRALLLTTGACAIHCRYCFRRHFPYNDSNPLARQWQQTLLSIKDDTTINEIILSGGDPLALTDNKLSSLVDDLEQIPHIKRLRIHSRLPIVLPERVDPQLLTWISKTRLKVIMVVHANHANEIDNTVAKALEDLRTAGCQMLNQAVLLKGINDSAASLTALSERLGDVNVMPYYLHLLDRVAGAGHFEVPEQKGIALVAQLRNSLSGYLVPRLVREQKGEASKTVIY